jgi:hypothetical protein
VLHAFTHNTILTNHKSTLSNEKQTGIADRDYVSAALIVTKPHPRTAALNRPVRTLGIEKASLATGRWRREPGAVSARETPVST